MNVRCGRGLLVMCLLVLPPRPARGESTGPGGLRGLLRARSADTAGRGALEVGFFTSLHALDDTSASTHVLSVTHLQLGYGVSGPLELGLALPVRARGVVRSERSRVTPTRRLGFGDLLANAKLALPVPGQVLRVGLAGTGSFPTGSRSRGMTSASTDLELAGLVTLDLSRLERFPPTRLHADVAYRWNRNETGGVGLDPLDDVATGGFWPPAYPALPPGRGPEANDQVLWRFGVEFATRSVTLFTEFAHDASPYVDAGTWRDRPTVVTQGALVKFRNGLNLKGAVDASLQKDAPPAEFPQLPEWRFTVGLTWRRVLTLGDRDQDGVGDKTDTCPDRAEDLDGFEDEDGCPDPDNDADGVPDRIDLAPDLPEDLDGFEDSDGRPDLDNDGDGIRDAGDACPNQAEDYDGFEDTDGCPDLPPAGEGGPR